MIFSRIFANLFCCVVAWRIIILHISCGRGRRKRKKEENIFLLSLNTTVNRTRAWSACSFRIKFLSIMVNQRHEKWVEMSQAGDGGEAMGGKRERDTGMREREDFNWKFKFFSKLFLDFLYFSWHESRAMKENCKFMWFKEMLALLLGVRESDAYKMIRFSQFFHEISLKSSSEVRL